MLIQPFITIQDEYLAALTNQQIADLQKLADELPGLIARIDKQKGQKPDEIKKESQRIFHHGVPKYNMMIWIKYLQKVRIFSERI